MINDDKSIGCSWCMKIFKNMKDYNNHTSICERELYTNEELEQVSSAAYDLYIEDLKNDRP